MLKCKVCGCEFTPVIDKHYVARDAGESGVSTVLKHVEGNLYDAFDCPVCGCQFIAQERKRIYPSCVSFLDELGKEKDSEGQENEQTT